jgi:hypothetical protein
VPVRRDRKVCKFLVEPIAVSSNNGFTAKELHQISAIIRDNLSDILARNPIPSRAGQVNRVTNSEFDAVVNCESRAF